MEPVCSVCGSEEEPRLCTGCKERWYCGEGCQREDWPAHKVACTAARAAAKAAAALALTPVDASHAESSQHEELVRHGREHAHAHEEHDHEHHHEHEEHDGHGHGHGEVSFVTSSEGDPIGGDGAYLCCACDHRRCCSLNILEESAEQPGSMKVRQAAEKGDARAQFEMGVVYDWGLSVGRTKVLRNKAAAYEWFKRSAAGGFVPAMFNLGVSYDNGVGCDRNEKDAAKWYRKAAEKGNLNGMINYGNCLLNGSGCERDDRGAIKWYKRAVAEESADGKCNLGACYALGLGVTRNEARAEELYAAAAEEDHEGGTHNLIELRARRAQGLSAHVGWMDGNGCAKL